MTPYVPPQGLADFVHVLQHCAARDAARLLTVAFRDCANDALLQQIRLCLAAPKLLEAGKLACDTLEPGRALDALVAAVDQAEHGAESLA